MYTFTVLLAVVSLLASSFVDGEDNSHGFGDDLPWVKWENARDVAKMQRKPIMLIIHKSWCGACQSLKAKFEQKSAQQQLKVYAKHFVISNVEDDEEPWEEEYQPDGKYIPRVIFTSPDGEVLNDIVNDKAEYEGYKYYYTNPAQVMTSMRKVMDMYGLSEKKDDKKKDVKKNDKADSKDESETKQTKEEMDEVKAEKKNDKKEETKPKPPPGKSDNDAKAPSAQPPSSKPPGKSEL